MKLNANISMQTCSKWTCCFFLFVFCLSGTTIFSLSLQCCNICSWLNTKYCWGRTECVFCQYIFCNTKIFQHLRSMSYEYEEELFQFILCGTWTAAPDAIQQSSRHFTNLSCQMVYNAEPSEVVPIQTSSRRAGPFWKNTWQVVGRTICLSLADLNQSDQQ